METAMSTEKKVKETFKEETCRERNLNSRNIILCNDIDGVLVDIAEVNSEVYSYM